MDHTQNKNRLLGLRARYFLAIVAAASIGASVFFIAYDAGRRAPRTQTLVTIDPTIEADFFALLDNVRQPEARAQFPAFDYVDAQGREQRFIVTRGEFVLLNIWATWCPPCLIELPDLEKLAARLPKDTKVRVMAVSVDHGYDQARLAAFLQDRGLWKDAASHDTHGVIMRNAPVRGLPSSFLLVEGGEILYIFEGAAPWADPASLAFFNALSPVR